jgi:hypothetical protein
MSPLEEALEKRQQAPSDSARTLTNTNVQPSINRMSEKDRRERAIAAFQGKLK